MIFQIQGRNFDITKRHSVSKPSLFSFPYQYLLIFSTPPAVMVVSMILQRYSIEARTPVAKMPRRNVLGVGR